MPFFSVSLYHTLLVSFKNCQTQYKQRHIQSPIKDLRCSFWQQQLTVPAAYSERSQTSKMKLFQKNIFSRPLFQPVTIYTRSSILDVPLCFEYASGTINYFRNRLHLDLWLGSRYTSDMFKKKDKNCKKPVKELFLETLQQRLELISEKFLRKLYQETIFFTVVFSKFCKKSRSSHQRCSIKKADLYHFTVFTGKHLCRGLFLIKL